MQGIDVTEVKASTVVPTDSGAVCAASERAVQPSMSGSSFSEFELTAATEVGDDALAHRAGVGAEVT